MNAQHATLIMIARIAAQDGVLSPIEEAYIGDVAEQLGISGPDAIISSARQHDVSSLMRYIKSYEDRFFIALRAWMIAHADDDLDGDEATALDEVIGRLGIRASDRALLHKTDPDMTMTQIRCLDARLDQLFRGSSFFEGF